MKNIILVPISDNIGLTSISLGVTRLLERNGLRVQFFKPITQSSSNCDDNSLIKSHNISVLESFESSYAQELTKNNQLDSLLEQVIERATANSTAEVTILEGLANTREQPFASQLNRKTAEALNADIIFVGHPANDSAEELKNRLDVVYQNWGGAANKKIIGCIINKICAPVDADGNLLLDLSEMYDSDKSHADKMNSYINALKNNNSLPLLGSIPFDPKAFYPRALDLCRHMDLKIINAGEMDHRRILKITFCAKSLPNLVEHLITGSLLVIAGDRGDVLIAASLAAMNGVKVGAILLTSGYHPNASITSFCQQGIDTGIPIFVTELNTWQTSLAIQSFNQSIPVDDASRIEYIRELGADNLDNNYFADLMSSTNKSVLLSPPAFRYKLIELARKAAKTIVLPEGSEPRTVMAAAICADKKIAKCVLLGCKKEIDLVAKQQGVVFNDYVSIVNPEDCLDKYIAPMVELRKNKGMTDVVAEAQLQDNVVLGTMMLAEGDVDGLVSGAVHTTANTIRPALQLIKTAPNSSLVSSVFFMLMPDQVYIYGDCAINPDPTAEQLADIAMQAADSALAFGIEPKVAMISYSTGKSGAGADVEKVRTATDIVRKTRPNISIDGPLQYDAAVIPNVAASKAPDSSVAGKANVFIFPDLNTGNTTYKAVQRSADVVSIGPMLQGMKKPVNDLSRGCLVDDIVYTIALTAIQSNFTSS